MLAFDGSVYKDGKFWLVEITGLNLMTQGRTKKEAYKMAHSVVVDASGNAKLQLKLLKTGNDTFTLFSDDLETLIPLLLKKQRQRAGISVMEAARRIGSNSANAYGAYEYGRAMPTLEKLDQLLSAVNPEHNVTLKCA